MEYLGDRISLKDIPEDEKSGRHNKFLDEGEHGEYHRDDGFIPCRSRQLIFKKTESSPHYGKYECFVCGRHYSFVKKPDNEGERNKSTNFSKDRIAEGKGFDSLFCFICLRKEQDLNKSEYLERDHIIPLDHGGNDEIGNLRLLCNTCHQRFKPWVRVLTGISPDNSY